MAANLRKCEPESDKESGIVLHGEVPIQGAGFVVDVGCTMPDGGFQRKCGWTLGAWDGSWPWWRSAKSPRNSKDAKLSPAILRIFA